MTHRKPRAEVAVADGRLVAVGAELNGTSQQEASLRQSLEQMEEELRHVNNTLAQKHELLHELLTSGFTDQFEKVKRRYAESTRAEERCNASVSGPLSAVEQSRNTRNATEHLLQQHKDQLLRNITAHNKSLTELQDKALQLDKREHSLSLKVCGGRRGANGSCSVCGGAGCRDPEGGAVCGGDGCSGTVSASNTAVNNARNVTDSVTAANDELKTIAKKLQDLAALTQDVKNQALNSLQKAQKKKEHVELNNRKLKDFIKKIKDFLTEEGADPESIQKVALQVLSISIPVNRTVLDTTLSQIRDGLSNLTDLEERVNHTAGHVGRARELLQRAQDDPRLEKKFRSNEQRMQRQRSELEELKGNVTFVRDEIRDHVQKYSSCT